MEDRLTPALYLELYGGSPEDWAASRLEAVAGVSGVTRVTWWSNQHLDRRDLPRSLRGPGGEDFPTLAVAERDQDGPVDVPAADDIVSLRFTRYPRPAQGRLTGRSTRGLQLVLIHARSDDESQALRDWGDFVHLRHIAEAACPGFAVITPYERAVQERGEGPRYLHLYEMDTDDPEPAFRAMTPLVASRLGGEDTQTFRRWAFHPALVIDYVNTFALVGERPAGD